MRAVVVGAGMVGICTAWELRQRGVEVVLVDRGEVSRGTTGLGEGNVLCGDKDAGPELDLTVAGMALFDELEALLGPVARIRRKGSLLVHPDERTWAAEPARVARLRAAGVDVSLVPGDEVAALEPALTGAVCGAARFAGDLQCDPRGIAVALAGRLPDVRTRTPVSEVVVREGRAVGVRAAGELLEADVVVVAAGPWSAPLLASAGLDVPVAPRKGQLARVKLGAPDEGFLRHKVVDGSYLLSVGSPEAGRQLSTVVETTWDGDVLIGSSRERCGFDGSVDDDLALQLRERAARLVPALADAPIAEAWVGFRPWLPDHLPAIGPSARVPGLAVATGHEGAGVALGPVTGRLLAQQLCAEPPLIDPTPFHPDRFHDGVRACNHAVPDPI